MPIEHTPLFSALIGGALLTLQTVLMLSVGMHRTKVAQGVGIGHDMTLERLVRRHGNLAENGAMFVIVLALFELSFGRTPFLLVVGCVFLAARLFHAIGFTSNAGSHLIDAQGSRRVFVLMRMAGAMLTALSTLTLGVWLIVSVLAQA